MPVLLADCENPCWPILISLSVYLVASLAVIALVSLTLAEVIAALIERRPAERRKLFRYGKLLVLTGILFLALALIGITYVPGITGLDVWQA